MNIKAILKINTTFMKHRQLESKGSGFRHNDLNCKGLFAELAFSFLLIPLNKRRVPLSRMIFTKDEMKSKVISLLQIIMRAIDYLKTNM